MSFSKENIYLISGQGSDYRIFKNLTLDTSKFEIHYLNWILPDKQETMNSFAKKMSAQIDTTQPFSIIGVSLGGMVACEMKKFLNPSQVIIISSAKSRNELPGQYKFQKYIPLNKITPKKLIKKSALFLQPRVEKDRKLEDETCDSMLIDKDPVFLKRTINLIVNWDSHEIDSTVVHIHGDNDNTIPIKNVSCNYIIKGGSHMMALTKPKEVSEILNKILRNDSN